MKRQIEMLKRYILHAENMATVIALSEGKVIQAKGPVPAHVGVPVKKCNHCKEGEVKTCQMHQKLYHKCQNCLKTWSIAMSAK